MANKTEQLAFEVGDKIAELQNVFLLHTEYKKEGKDYYLRLFLDSDGGVGIDECEAFSRAFSEEFDKVDPIDTPYILEVSSPGVDRKLTTEREFLHFLNSRVEVKLFAEADGVKDFAGVLLAYKDSVASILADSGKQYDIRTKDAAYIKLEFTI